MNNHPARAFASEQSAKNFREASIVSLRDAYRAAGIYFSDDNMKIFAMEVER